MKSIMKWLDHLCLSLFHGRRWTGMLQCDSCKSITEIYQSCCPYCGYHRSIRDGPWCSAVAVRYDRKKRDWVRR